MKDLTEELVSVVGWTLLYRTIKHLYTEDCYVSDFAECEDMEYFLSFLCAGNLTWIASDDRILLTPLGEEFLQLLTSAVELG